jgi:DNA-binding MarR family transcriptional regulator
MEPLFECNCAAVRSAARAVTKAYDDVLRPLELRMTQYTILSKVNKEGQLALSDLADRMVMDRTTLARNVKPLEREGWLEVVVGSDRRERLLSVTATGKALLERARPLWLETSRRLDEKLGPQQAETLRITMREVVKAARELSEEAAA